MRRFIDTMVVCRGFARVRICTCAGVRPGERARLWAGGIRPYPHLYTRHQRDHPINPCVHSSRTEQDQRRRLYGRCERSVRGRQFSLRVHSPRTATVLFDNFVQFRGAQRPGPPDELHMAKRCVCLSRKYTVTMLRTPAIRCTLASPSHAGRQTEYIYILL